MIYSSLQALKLYISETTERLSEVYIVALFQSSTILHPETAEEQSTVIT